MINKVIHFRNGMVMVFDEDGQQMSDYQGKHEDVKEKILDNAPVTASFFRSDNLVSEDIEVSRDEFLRGY